MQNKCICFCLKLDKMHHISEEEFGLINWLPTSKRVDQCINTITYNFVNNTCPYYLNGAFEFAADKKKFLILVPLFGTAYLTQLKSE